MNVIVFIVSLLITGIIFGALGRLAVPGPNPMSIGMTILVGIVGAFVGGLIGALLSAPAILVIILEILCAAGIVFLMQRRGVRGRTY
jgi:uncharacterized membrane protein YeaQ/YmgE (transglycosylase-associated protein family)